MPNMPTLCGEHPRRESQQCDEVVLGVLRAKEKIKVSGGLVCGA